MTCAADADKHREVADARWQLTCCPSTFNCVSTSLVLPAEEAEADLVPLSLTRTDSGAARQKILHMKQAPAAQHARNLKSTTVLHAIVLTRRFSISFEPRRRCSLLEPAAPVYDRCQGRCGQAGNTPPATCVCWMPPHQHDLWMHSVLRLYHVSIVLCVFVHACKSASRRCTWRASSPTGKSFFICAPRSC